MRKPMPSLQGIFRIDANGARRRKAYFGDILGMSHLGNWSTFVERAAGSYAVD